MNTQKNYDVIIIGGGLVGLLQCTLLAQSGINTLCLDQQTEQDFQNSPVSKRTTAISYGSSLILKRANIWEQVEKLACPIQEIKIMDGGSPVLLNFNAQQNDASSSNDTFGWVIENHHLRAILVDTLQQYKNADYKTDKALDYFTTDQDHISVTTTCHKTYQATLLIGADGRASKVRELAKIETENYSYNQRAIVSIVTHQNPHQNTAIEHFKASGPFAILPMGDDQNGAHRSSIVWTEEISSQNSITKYDEITYLAGLKARFPDNYGEIISTTERLSYPLGFIHAHRYIDNRLALIGDAAHGIHPIAGQGLNLGLRDVNELSDLIITAHNNNEGIGTDTLLDQYQNKRRSDNDLMSFATDSINRIFSNQMPITRLGRKIGLRLIDEINPVKELALTYMMGKRHKTKT